ncbi:AAA family ATPase [Paenibacillus sp. SC116]|uniref:uridine kinase family protein n=1 Tax=Paenibacillus sp. SC116 TaxID=2968986 RepID=UPI00215A579A|nr:AAA family ATPase [Paenibacillus sp. SC116]MCR8842695.1 AAA family ATPase [Paenibacillus sp. SC116]
MTNEQIVSYINQIDRNRPALLIAIDGCGGSGKSTLARKLQASLSNATLIHMDDFYLPSDQRSTLSPADKPVGADFDWQRVKQQVLEPLSHGEEGCYQRYDWETDSLAEWHRVKAEGIVIIEGVCSIRLELANDYDLTIWVDCPRETRLARGLERDGEAARSLWEENWMIAEDKYVNEHQPDVRAHIVILS